LEERRGRCNSEEEISAQHWGGWSTAEVTDDMAAAGQTDREKDRGGKICWPRLSEINRQKKSESRTSPRWQIQSLIR